tara:strand:- start:395 stop:2365 length:1971 start_codon:yes stop_codon:yes gene_type:complete
MIPNLQNILKEWSYRVGVIKPNEEKHLFQLHRILVDEGWPLGVINEVIQSLTEAKADVVAPTLKQAREKAKKGQTYSSPRSNQVYTRGKEKDGEEQETEKSTSKEFKSDIDKEYFNSEVDPSDEQYEKQKPEQLETTDGKPLKFSDDEIEFLSGKFPKKYIKVLERIMNTKKTGTFEPNIKSFINAAGAGQISSTAGEIMTMMAVSMDEKQFNFLEQKLGEHFDNLSDSVSDADLILDRDWIESAKGVRQGVSERYDDYYGKGNWEIVGSAWDTKDDVEGMGFDYSKKGFSTDAYFRLKVNGEDVLDELSLKKDFDVALSQPGVNEVFYWTLATDKDDKKEYDEIIEKLQEVDDAGKQVVRGKNRSELVKRKKELLEKHQNIIGDDGNPSVRTKRENESSNKYLKNLNQKQLDLLKSAKDDDFDIPILKKTKTNKYMKTLASELTKMSPPISSEQLNDVIKKLFKKGGQKYVNKATMITARLLSHLGDKTSTNHVDERIGITAKFTKAFMKNIVDVPEIKDGILSTIREKFPLNTLMSGEETMALGGVSADKKVMKEIFGTDNYDEIETNLEVSGPNEKGFYQLLYKVKGTDKVVNLADLRARQRGIGYSTTPNFEMTLHEDFKGELYRSNVSLGRDVHEPGKTEKSSLKNKYGRG